MCQWLDLQLRSLCRRVKLILHQRTRGKNWLGGFLGFFFKCCVSGIKYSCGLDSENERLQTYCRELYSSVLVSLVFQFHCLRELVAEKWLSRGLCIAGGFCVLQAYKTEVAPFRKSKKELCLDVWDGVLSFTYDVCIVGVAMLFV